MCSAQHSHCGHPMLNCCCSSKSGWMCMFCLAQSLWPPNAALLCPKPGWMCMVCSAQLLWPSNAELLLSKTRADAYVLLSTVIVAIQCCLLLSRTWVDVCVCVHAGLRIQSGGVPEGQASATASRTDTQTSSCGPPLLRCCTLTATSLRGSGRCPEGPTATYPMSMPSKHTSQSQ